MKIVRFNLVKYSLSINILSMVNFKKYSFNGGLKIKEHPVSAGDAEGKSNSEIFDFLNMKPWIFPVFSETLFLDFIEPFNVRRQFAKDFIKIFGFNYFHTDRGGYFLTALRYEFKILLGWAYSFKSSLGISKTISFLRRRISSSIVWINFEVWPESIFLFVVIGWTIYLV